jgi:hemolysin activation/secretion protein
VANITWVGRTPQRTPKKLGPWAAGLLLLSLSVAVLPTARAQALPTNLDAGTITPSPIQTIEQQRQQDRLYNAPGASEIETIELDVPEVAPQVPWQQGSNVTIKQVQIAGSTILEQNDLMGIMAPYGTRALNHDDITAIMAAINSKYAEKGYVTSRAYIPNQDIQDGTLVIRVVEGKIGSLSVTGHRFTQAQTIADAVEAKPGSLLNLTELEKSLNDINSAGGPYRLRAEISAGQTAGSTDVKLLAEEKLPIQITPFVDNRGRPAIGMYHWGARLTYDNPLHLGDYFSLEGFQSNGSQGRGTEAVTATYSVPVIPKLGTKLNLVYGYSHVDVQLPFVVRDIDGYAHKYGLSFSQPLGKYFTLDLGGSIRRTIAKVNNWTTGVDDVSAINVGLTFNASDKWGSTYLNTTSTIAVDMFGANRQYWLQSFAASRVFNLPHRNFLLINAAGQTTSSPMPGMDQMMLGGATTVRGYNEALVFGDRVFRVNLEHRWPVPGLKKVCPWLDERVQGATFVDVGQAWLDKTFAKDNQFFLAGAGLGLRYRLSQYLYGFVDFGFGLADREALEPNGQPLARLHFGVRSDLLPTSYRARSKKVTQL